MVTMAVTTYCGRAGDHNDQAMAASQELGAGMARRLSVPNSLVGTPAPAQSLEWRTELQAALPDLQQMATRLDGVLRRGQVPASVITRCAVALATVPTVLHHHPETALVWLDAHADLNTPTDTITGYLGGMALSGPLGWWDSGFGSGLPESQAILVGTRDLDPAEQHHIDAERVRPIGPGPAIGGRLTEAIADRPVYVHLDCDVLEPGLFSTDYHVPGGLSLDELHDCAQAAASSDIVGVEISEYEGPAHAGPSELLDALAPLWA